MSKPTRILVYGGEKQRWEIPLWRAMRRLHQMLPDCLFLLPFERGVPAAAWAWCKTHNVPAEKFVADVFTYDSAAGFERNKEIFYSKVDFAILLPGGYYQKNFRELCQSHKVRIIEPRT